MMKTLICFVLVVPALVIASGSAFLRKDPAGTSMTAAAETFVESLSEAQRGKTLYAYDSPKRIGWHFIPLAERKGLQLKEMDDAQRKAAHALLRAALSQAGYDTSTYIMGLEKLLHELEKGKAGSPIRDSERYYFTLFGKPDAESKWGLSVEGHHLSLNFVVEKNRLISTTPQFFGANPGKIMADYPVGPKKGSRILNEEEDLGFALVNALKDKQLATAMISEKAPSEIRNAATPQPPTEKPVGVAAADLSEAQRGTLRKLIEVYAAKMPKEIATARLEAIDKAGFEKIQFAWAGAREAGEGHYYRVEGPTFQIEFCNTQADAAGNRANHIHSVWRDTAGDFAIPVAHK
jgi:hypothetical protein